MNENIDLTKILKNCPCGTEFWSIGQGAVVFLGIDRRRSYPILFDRNAFTKEGYDCLNKECVLVPSREQQDWSKFDAPWYKKDKFDPHTLKPFDKVLVRYNQRYIWKCDLFSHMEEGGSPYMFHCISGRWCECIPYNKHTKHIAGTADEAPEYYRYWEK